jgi:hypothetical protein
MIVDHLQLGQFMVPDEMDISKLLDQIASCEKILLDEIPFGFVRAELERAIWALKDIVRVFPFAAHRRLLDIGHKVNRLYAESSNSDEKIAFRKSQ